MRKLGSFSEKFKNNVLGVISDIRFPKEGRLDEQAGLELIRRIRAEAPLLPVLLQSSDIHHAEAARPSFRLFS